MQEIQIRRFARSDRDQVTSLVNAHIAAVVPNASVSTQTLLSQLERDPGEYIVDPWVTRRETLVAQVDDRVVAAAHLLRYDAGARVSQSYRDAGEIRWLVCWPQQIAAGSRLAEACLAQLSAWAVSVRYADGTLPAPGVYGVPEQWPHVRQIYADCGFTGSLRTESVYLVRVEDLVRPDAVPVPGLAVARSVGICGTRLSATIGAEVVGYVEVDTNLDAGGRMSRFGQWADIGNLMVQPIYRRRGVGTWLVAQAAAWLSLGGVTRLLDYAGPTELDYTAFLNSLGFRRLTTTVRGLRHHDSPELGQPD